MKKVDKNTPIGTKVVPIDKTVEGYCKLKDSPTWTRLGGKEQGFLYYQGHEEEENCALCSAKDAESEGYDYYNYSDLVLYEGTNIPIQLPPAIKDRIKELEDEVKRLKEKYEPYDIGELYAFADNEKDFEENDYLVGKLTDTDVEGEISTKAIFECNGHSWYTYARKIKTIELCQ